MNTTPSTKKSDSTPAVSNRPSPHGQRELRRRPLPSGARALVLGGGGATGNAWEIGVIAGLFEAGVDVTSADLVIGTSAGSTAAVQVCGARPTALLAAVLDVPPPLRPRTEGSGGSNSPSKLVADHLDRTNRIIAAAGTPAEMRRAMGAAALALPGSSDESAQQRWRAVVAPRLPGPDWPQREVMITAVDAVTGDPVVFDRRSGVDVVDAVAASCASGFAYQIGDRQYIDGGYRRNENADLATGCARVLVLSPFGGRTRHPEHWGMQLDAQVDELQATGSRVETIRPGDDAEHLFGVNATDVALRSAAAKAGHDLGRSLAARLGAFWL